jgi:hypothetical protein
MVYGRMQLRRHDLSDQPGEYLSVFYATRGALD